MNEQLELPIAAEPTDEELRARIDALEAKVAFLRLKMNWLFGLNRDDPNRDEYDEEPNVAVTPRPRGSGHGAAAPIPEPEEVE